MVFIAAYFYLPGHHDTVARAGMSPAERRELLEEKQERDRAELEAYGWIDRSEGRVRLSIERAMDIAVDEINERGGLDVEDFDGIDGNAESSGDDDSAEVDPEEESGETGNDELQG